jgi:hypothetical protein
MMFILVLLTSQLSGKQCRLLAMKGKLREKKALVKRNITLHSFTNDSKLILSFSKSSPRVINTLPSSQGFSHQLSWSQFVTTGSQRAFPRALAQISSNLIFSQRQNQIFTNANMKKLAMKLYIKYFHFLCHAMKWYTSSKHRFWKAFSQRFYDEEVASKVQTSKAIVQEIVQEARLGTQQTVIAIFEASQATYKYVQNVPTREDMQHLGKQLQKSLQMTNDNNSLVYREVLEKIDYMFKMVGALAEQSLVASGGRQFIERGGGFGSSVEEITLPSGLGWGG